MPSKTHLLTSHSMTCLVSTIGCVEHDSQSCLRVTITNLDNDTQRLNFKNFLLKGTTFLLFIECIKQIQLKLLFCLIFKVR